MSSRMKLKERFRRLTVWNKLAAIAGVATLIGVVLSIYGISTDLMSKKQNNETSALISDVAKRLAKSNFDLLSKDALVLAFDAKDYPTAERLLDLNLRALNRKQAAIEFYKGLVDSSTGDSENALEHFRKAAVISDKELLYSYYFLNLSASLNNESCALLVSMFKIELFRIERDKTAVINEEIDIGVMYNNMAACYMHMGEFGSAVEALDVGLALKDSRSDIKNLMMNNLGFALFHKAIRSKIPSDYRRAMVYISDGLANATLEPYHQFATLGSVMSDDVGLADIAISGYESVLNERTKNGSAEEQILALRNVCSSIRKHRGKEQGFACLNRDKQASDDQSFSTSISSSISIRSVIATPRISNTIEFSDITERQK
jgi:tetratricopeptide (TPR) repeat protein